MGPGRRPCRWHHARLLRAVQPKGLAPMQHTVMNLPAEIEKYLQGLKIGQGTLGGKNEPNE